MRLNFIGQTISFTELTSKVSDDVTVISLENMKLEGGEDDLLKLSKVIRGHPSLEEFSFINVSIVDSSVDLDQLLSIIMVTVPHISVIRLEGMKITAASVSTVAFSTSLKELRLANNNLSDEDAAGVASAVSKSTSIELLDLSGNNLSDVGCLAFDSALKQNSSIQTLSLEGNANVSGESRNKIEVALRERSGGAPRAA